MVKVTFSFDDETVRLLRVTADRLRKSQSLVVREAIAEYGARSGRLTEAERRRMLGVVDAMMKRPSTGSSADVAQELREVRRARRHGGRRHPAE
jgi:Ribbon-helix-helix protein, copG family.